VQFDALWSSTSNKWSDSEAPKASTSKGCERCYNLDIDAPCAQSQHSNIDHVLVGTCDDVIGKENDHLNREVKKIELEVKVEEAN
jgi:hypothetical protein